MEFKQGQLANIVYFNETKQEVTQRRIIPVFVPRQTMKAIDVSDLSEEEVIKLQALYEEYAKYYEDFVANAFNFETWVEHTKGETITPKWRAFKLINIRDIV